MKARTLEEAIRNIFGFIGRFLPPESALYVPLVSAALAWASRGVRDWKERILAFRVWLDPSRVRAKPDAFVLDFFRSHSRLRQAFSEELEREDMVALREAFECLYPVIGLEDPFLLGLFHGELENRAYRQILKSFKRRVKQAVDEIAPVEGDEDFLGGLETLARETVRLIPDMMSEKEVQKALLRIWEQKHGGDHAE